MTTATAAPMYATRLPMPSTVQTYFDTLRAFGTIKGIDGNYNVTLHVPSEDHGGGVALGARLLLLAQALGKTGISPAFPTGPARYFSDIGGGTYRWAFSEPVYAGDGEWAVVVPTIDDLRHVLDTVTGLAGFDRAYAGEPVLPVTYELLDTRNAMQVMRDDLRNIEDGIEAYIGERVTFTRPRQER